ncbi:MAG: MMPL family transporter [Candidatus Marinimicrobia bacterium]|nr:MMPL family transporter [Candidatus Neomarinimicrobiota bacterium]
MREKILRKLAQLQTNHPRKMLIFVIAVTIICIILASRIQITPKWSDMLPKGDKRTVEFDRILDEFVSASSLIIVVQGEEDKIKAFADAIAPKLLAPIINPKNKTEEKIYVRRVNYKQDVDFIRNHGFALTKESDLKNMQDIFQDPNLVPLLTNINNSFEKEYIETDKSLSSREKEDGAYQFLNGIENWLEVMESYLSGEELPQKKVYSAVDKLLVGEPYFISYDRKALILNVIPNFSMMDANLMVEGTDAVQSVVTETLNDFPGVQAGLTGTIPMGRDEMVYGTEGLAYTSIISLIAIGILLIISFRMWVAPILALLNLVVGLIWAAGLSAIFVPVLNIMTLMFFVILIGLGIDFSIHIIAGFTEMRSLGYSTAKATEECLLKFGKGIMTGALTTACAFFALMIGESRAMSEMGLIAGIGLLAVVAVTFILLPTLLVIRERRREKHIIKKGTIQKAKPKDISFIFLGQIGVVLKERYIFTIIGAIIVTALLSWSASKITFNYNYMDMEPEGIPSITLQDTVLDKFDLSMDFAYLVAESVEESRQLAEVARDYSSIAVVEDISLSLPSPGEQKKRNPYIEEIRRFISGTECKNLLSEKELNVLKQELERLKMNIIEMQDLAFTGGQDKIDRKCGEIVGYAESENSTVFRRLESILNRGDKNILSRLNSFQKNYFHYFKDNVLQMANTDPILLENLPAPIVDRYANEDRNLFLITVLPADNIWQDARFLYRFTDDLDKISERATGFPPVFRALIDVIGRDGRNAAILTIIVVFILLLIDFRNVGHALMAMIPLLMGMVWMVGIMQIIGRQLDIMNIMAIPLILGIGIDDGVHIIHRWRREGRGSVKTVFASTGKAILLTSLTTMLAFGSLIFSLWRGYGSLGTALLIGVGACFITTVFILPGIIGWIERKRE